MLMIMLAFGCGIADDSTWPMKRARASAAEWDSFIVDLLSQVMLYFP